jgi:NADH dehydrogenase
MTDTNQLQHIVIVGGGFGGVKTALELADDTRFKVTLISDRPDFWYYPTLYHTATGGDHDQSSIPLDRLLHGKKVEFVLGHMESIDKSTKTIILNETTVTYDKLVLALGVVTNYFGIPGLAEFSYGIKTMDEAEKLKKHLHQQITDGRKPDLNYIVVGGGPTGIELAGALPAYLHAIMKQHNIPNRAIHVDLIENAPHLMPRMPQRVGKSIARQLRSLGVKLYLGKAVQGETADELTVSGKPIRSHTVIWTAGMANSPFFGPESGFEQSPRHKVVVDEFLRSSINKDIFIIGDNAETMYSGMAQTAIHDAEFVAHNFKKEASNEPKLAYRPKQPVYVTPAGPKWASVEWGKLHINGRLGWLLREAGDFVAFSDLEPLPSAALQWAHAGEREDLCQICGAVA